MGTPIGGGIPTKPRHQRAWVTILGGAPDRPLAPQEQSLAGLISRGAGAAYGIWHASATNDIEFAGTSEEDLRGFPQVARQRAGYQLHLAQGGHSLSDSQLMAEVGFGCSEIRVRDSRGSLDDYGVYFVGGGSDTVYVLHCFQWKGHKGAIFDIDLGKQRYEQLKELIRAQGVTASTQRHVSLWDALEDTPGATENLRIRSVLMQELGAHIASAGMAESEAARHFDVTQPRISDLMRGRIDLFSIDTLVSMLAAAGLHLGVQVRDIRVGEAI
jgi:predicted XRE-type DNA-binding protein/phage-related protein